MTPDRAAFVVLEHLRTTFGKLARIRAPEQRRRAAGLTWCVPVVIPTSEGDVSLGDVDVDEAGRMSPVLEPEHAIRALWTGPPSVSKQASIQGISEADTLFQEIAAEAGADHDDVETSSRRLRDLFRRTDETSLLEARRLLPHLLGNAGRRGRVLMMMAEVERKLGHTRLALGYLDGAAHELADRFDLTTLEQASSMALAIGGEEAFAHSPVRDLLQRCRERLLPLADLFDCPALALVPNEHRPAIEESALILMLAPGDVLVREGEPSTSIFVIKSGVMAVVHEKPVPRFIRCCSPGWLLGETSVLVDKDPRCTATLRTDHLTEVWQIDAALMRQIMEDVPELSAKIQETKAVHGLDSFLSTHRSVGQLDAEVRNEMLKCMQGIQTFEERTVVILAGAVPEAACLVARGKITIHEGAGMDDAPVAEVGADEFVGVRDILHQIATPRTAVAEAGSTIVFLGAEELRSLAERNPEQAAVVLERLG
ncbi:MAG: cyclic nucleotide-binding domain-containing protein [Polyangiaceae bacterium]